MVEKVEIGEAALYQGDCRENLPQIADVDAVVTDPPYELGFMGKTWDASGIAYNPDMWRLVLKAMKPGAYLLAFGGSRTYHRMASAIKDAGFEIRDQIMWLYGSGSTGKATVKEGFRFVGIEREPEYFEIAQRRIASASGHTTPLIKWPSSAEQSTAVQADPQMTLAV